MTDINYLYQDPNFDIETIPNFNNTDSYSELSMYLDFACHTTIRKQMPSIRFDLEKQYAKQLITQYLGGDTEAFTRQFGIRQNMNKIGKDKIRGILIANMIEKEGYNIEYRKLLSATEYDDQCARYITQITYSGTLMDETNYSWITKNLEILVESYVEMKYAGEKQVRNTYQYYTEKNPTTQKAMENLNLEMRLQTYKK